MSRKDYILIANGFADANAKAEAVTDGDKRASQLHAVWMSAYAVASRLQVDNPRFNKDRFLRACEVA